MVEEPSGKLLAQHKDRELSMGEKQAIMKAGCAHDPKHTNSLVHQGEGSVIVQACMTASGIGTVIGMVAVEFIQKFIETSCLLIFSGMQPM